jgi:hypothetical protein
VLISSILLLAPSTSSVSSSSMRFCSSSDCLRTNEEHGSRRRIYSLGWTLL